MTTNRIPKMTGLYAVTVTFPDVSDASLDLDFEPIITTFNLQKFKKFVLCHWQSRPKGIRGFGFYDWVKKQYFCIDWNNVAVHKVQTKFLQLDETIIKSSPSAVICYPRAELFTNGSHGLIT
ncbi:MAG: hypothetical protein F6K62_16785 [Sphaerospermopsis sp. SIO1G2]|nr:hypothetical protein [Sphaerospermopsis sp. SIO1G2]